MYVKVVALCLLAFARARSPLIARGSNAAKGEFPWQISLQNRFVHICGGSILNPRWVLTAGHCVYQQPIEDYNVVAGIHSLKDNGQMVKIKRVIVHPDYLDSEPPKNDIALLELDVELKFGANVGHVELPEKNAIPTGNSTLSGWGNINSYEFPNILQRIDLPVLSYTECRKVGLPFDEFSEHVTESNICTGQNKKGQNFCCGDSGGPLVTKGGNTQIGIVSWTFGHCGSSCAPSVYTRVSAFIDWINKYIN